MTFRPLSINELERDVPLRFHEECLFMLIGAHEFPTILPQGFCGGDCGRAKLNSKRPITKFGYIRLSRCHSRGSADYFRPTNHHQRLAVPDHLLFALGQYPARHRPEQSFRSRPAAEIFPIVTRAWRIHRHDLQCRDDLPPCGPVPGELQFARYPRLFNSTIFHGKDIVTSFQTPSWAWPFS